MKMSLNLEMWSKVIVFIAVSCVIWANMAVIKKITYNKLQ